MKRIISTQIPDQFEKLKALLADKVELLNSPMIKIKPVEENVEVLDEIKEVVDYNWLIFTSMRGAQCFFTLYNKTGLDKEKLDNLKFACIGESTNDELKRNGFETDYINPGNTSKEFCKNLIKDILAESDKVFLPLGNRANNYLPTKLAEFCKVTRINVYRTEGVEKLDKEFITIIKEGAYDLMIITSPSAIENFIKLTAFKPEINELKIASIGATTNEAIEKFGYSPLLTASKSNIKVLAKEILKFIKE